MAAANSKGLKDYYSFVYKAPAWKNENVYFWKDKLESYFLGFNEDLLEMILNGYTHPTNEVGSKIGRKYMNELQLKDFQNHHKARTILLDAIPYDVYEKLAKKESAYDLVESLRSLQEEKSYEKTQEDVTSCEESRSSEDTSESERSDVRIAENDVTENSQKDADLSTSENDELSHTKSEQAFLKQVFLNVSKFELVVGLSEMIEKYNLLKVGYNKLQSSLISEQEFLKVELSELKENNKRLSNSLEKALEKNVFHQLSENRDISKEVDYNFQKFLEDSLYRSDLASSIYKVNRNYRYGIGYKLPSEEYPKHPISVDDVIIKYTPLYSHFIYGHDHDLKFTSSVNKFAKPISQSEFRKNFRRTNKRGPRKVWVPKKKIVDDAGVYQSKEKPPSSEKVLWKLPSDRKEEVNVQKGIT